MENLMKDEVPPEYLWEDPEGLEQWWKLVAARRDLDVEVSDSPVNLDGDQTPDLAENDLARTFKD